MSAPASPEDGFLPVQASCRTISLKNGPCTLDRCEQELCSHRQIPGCCTTKGDCDDGIACTTDECDTQTFECSFTAPPGCCRQMADCDDGDPCTTDSCTAGTGACAHASVSGCCRRSADCDDGNDRVPGGYCTHECQTDADCCAVPGECRTTLPEVCAPFESAGKKYCFLSCEVADIEAHEGTLFRDGGAIDANLFCKERANPSFGCRSTGGGKENRKVCTP